MGIKAGANETILHLQSCHYQALPGVPAQPLCGLHASVGTCPLFSNRCLPVEAGLQGLHPCKPSFAYKHLLAPDCFLETFEAFGL